jgi:hypothetical protein
MAHCGVLVPDASVDWLESWDGENPIRSVPKLSNNEISRPVRSSELVKDRNIPKRCSKSGRGGVDEVRESQESFQGFQA